MSVDLIIHYEDACKTNSTLFFPKQQIAVVFFSFFCKSEEEASKIGDNVR